MLHIEQNPYFLIKNCFQQICKQPSCSQFVSNIMIKLFNKSESPKDIYKSSNSEVYVTKILKFVHTL